VTLIIMLAPKSVARKIDKAVKPFQRTQKMQNCQLARAKEDKTR